MRVIGTAGHVDHGKSTLVEAMTGTHPDRLKEEREREMTIDLGFAWLTLPNGEEVGIVDVPGHRDFIENMLAGIGGIDAVLFVIAVDEGIMPQTKEHLAILDLLQIQGGVVALTKIDMVKDPDWLDLIEDDIRKTLQGTVLESAPLVRVSARFGLGLQELLESLALCLDNRPPRIDLGRPRLPVDRVFSMPGFGTVVTGTLTDGHLSIGDDVVILPQGLRGRVRGLQSHKRKTEKAFPGSRTAINISGVNLDQVIRGNVIARPDTYQPTRRVDVQFHLLLDASQPVKHNMTMKLFVGTSEVIARLRLLGKETILPGEHGWLQLELDDPIIVNRGDHYILRKPSPSETIGGGMIVNAHPKGRHKRFVQGVLDQLQSMAQGSPSDRLLQVVISLGVVSKRESISRAGLDGAQGDDAFNELLSEGLILTLVPGEPLTQINNDSLVVSKVNWDRECENLLQLIQNYHLSSPLRMGMPREEVKSRLKISPRLYNAVVKHMVTKGDLMEKGVYLHLPEHKIHFSSEQQRRLDELMALFKASPNSPPSIKECQSLVGDDLYSAWIELGELVPVSSEVVFRTSDFARLKDDVLIYLKNNGTITVADARDLFNSSRRYILAFLEYLDSKGITVREGDVRRLPARPSSR